MKRPSWDEFWFLLCLVYSIRATCDRARVATLLIDKNNRIISAGYNGSAPGEPHCDDIGHKIEDGHCVRTKHSESNAIDNVPGGPERLQGATAVVLITPCFSCATNLMDAGIKRIVFTKEYRNARDRELVWRAASERGVVVERIDLDLRELLVNAVKILESKGGAFYNSKQKGE